MADTLNREIDETAANQTKKVITIAQSIEGEVSIGEEVIPTLFLLFLFLSFSLSLSFFSFLFFSCSFSFSLVFSFPILFL